MNVLLLNKIGSDNETVLKIYKKLQSEGHNVLRIANALTDKLFVSNGTLTNEKDFYRNIFYSIDLLLDKCDEVWLIEDNSHDSSDIYSWTKGVAFGKHKTIRTLFNENCRNFLYNASAFCVVEEVDSIQNYLNNSDNECSYNVDIDDRELSF